MIDAFTFVTAAGPLEVVGRLYADPARPVLLVVGGAFPPKDFKSDLVQYLPGASVLILRYPGMHSTPWADPRPQAIAMGVDSLIRTYLTGRRIVAYGLSTGSLVTLNLQSPEVRRHVAEEPFLHTAHLTGFAAYGRMLLRDNPGNAGLQTFLSTVFGLTEDRLEDRDYTHLLSDPALPLDLIVGSGGEQPMPDGTPGWPSFTTPEDRQTLLARPKARLYIGPPDSGHSLDTSDAARTLVRGCVVNALRALSATA